MLFHPCIDRGIPLYRAVESQQFRRLHRFSLSRKSTVCDSERDRADAKRGRRPINGTPVITADGAADGGSYIADEQQRGKEFGYVWHLKFLKGKFIVAHVTRGSNGDHAVVLSRGEKRGNYRDTSVWSLLQRRCRPCKCVHRRKIVRLQFGVIIDDLLLGHSRRKPTQDIPYSDAQTADTWVALAFARLDHDARTHSSRVSPRGATSTFAIGNPIGHRIRQI